MTATVYFYMAPQSGIEPPYYALRPLRLINSQVSYQLEYRGINLVRVPRIELGLQRSEGRMIPFHHTLN